MKYAIHQTQPIPFELFHQLRAKYKHEAANLREHFNHLNLPPSAAEETALEAFTDQTWNELL